MGRGGERTGERKSGECTTAHWVAMTHSIHKHKPLTDGLGRNKMGVRVCKQMSRAEPSTRSEMCERKSEHTGKWLNALRFDFLPLSPI